MTTTITADVFASDKFTTDPAKRMGTWKIVPERYNAWYTLLYVMDSEGNKVTVNLSTADARALGAFLR